MTDHKNLMREKYGRPLTAKTFDVVYEYAYREHHAYGESEIECHIPDLVDLADNIRRANRITA